MSREFKRYSVSELKIKVEDDVSGNGILKGYLSVFNKIENNRWPDRILPGAYTKTISEQPGGLPITTDHDWAVMKMNGRTTVLKEDSYGLYFEFPFASTEHAQDVRKLYKEGVATDFSIGYEAIKSDTELLPDGRELRNLREIRLYEGSCVMLGMDEYAKATGVKSMDSRIAKIEEKLGLSEAGEGQPPATLESAKENLTPDEPGKPLAGNIELYKALTDQARAEFEFNPRGTK